LLFSSIGGQVMIGQIPRASHDWTKSETLQWDCRVRGNLKKVTEPRSAMSNPRARRKFCAVQFRFSL